MLDSQAPLSASVRLIQAFVGAFVFAAVLVMSSPAHAEKADSCGPSEDHMCLTASQPTGYEGKYCSQTEGAGVCMTCYQQAGWICPSAYGEHDIPGYSDTWM